MDSPFKLVIEMIACLLLLAAAVNWHIKIRSEKFGSWDMIIFGVLGILFDLILYKSLRSYQPSSDGYNNLGVLMLFLLLVPLASFCNSVFIAAILWNFLSNRAIVVGFTVLVVGSLTLACLLLFFSEAPPKEIKPHTVQNESQLQSNIDGEEWSFANNTTADQCRKRAPNTSFLEGCMKNAQVKK